MPQISAHHYNRAYFGGTPSQDSHSVYSPCSTPIARNFSPESDLVSAEVSVESFSTIPFSSLESSHLNAHYVSSPTPDSPLNSSMDYRSTFPDIPAVFHHGGGKRGGVRISSNWLQEYSLFASKQTTIRSPLSNHGSSRSSHSLRSSLSNPSSRVHLLNVSGGRFRTPDCDDISPLHIESPHETVTSDIPVVPAFALSDDPGNLLRVLLALSSKFDLNLLNLVMICNSVEHNPNASINARLCYDFLNTGVCKRESSTGICKFRHVLHDHIDAVIDKIRNGKVGFMPC